MFKFQKYNLYLSLYHLNKLNLKKSDKNLKATTVNIFINDKKKDNPKIFFHYVFSLILYNSFSSILYYADKKSGKFNSQVQMPFLLYFFNKQFFKKNFWIF